MKLSELIEILVNIQGLCNDPDVEFKCDVMTFQAMNITAEGTCNMSSVLQGKLDAEPSWEETVTIRLEEI